MVKPILAAILSVKSHILSDAEKYMLEQYNPLGIALFDRNIISRTQIADLIASIKEIMGREDVIIAVDEEGGRVKRLKYVTHNLVSQNILGQTDNLNITSIHAKITSSEMQQIGANFIFAPVLDVDYPDTTVALKNRCFSNDKEKIVKHGKIMCQEYINQGICPCIKHIPGHGRAITDSHAQLPIIDSSIQELDADFYPFRQLNNMPAAMSGHILLKQVDGTNPVTISKISIEEIIRKYIGFDGLLISDALEMKALKGTIVQKALNAWEAGCDVVCYCQSDEQQMLQLCEKGKYLNDKSLERFEKIKNIICSKKETIVLDNQIKEYYSATSSFTEDNINYDATEVLHQIKKGEN